jgi:uncharacterized protein YndB with AHSA1/START domain
MIAAIEKTIELDAEPERVWKALTVGNELARWFPDVSAFDMEPDAHGAFTWEQHGSYAARVEAFEPPSLLTWRWVRKRDTDVESGQTTLVEFRLRPRPGGGTILDLRESGFARPEDRQDNNNGWDQELGELVCYLQP